MATLISLKRRINAATNISKTTRAMQMIAASRLKKAQEATLSGRPYVEKLTQLTQEASAKTVDSKKHPFMKASVEKEKTLLIVISPDKGLCGGLVTNLLKEYLAFAKNEEPSIIVLGKKLESQVVRTSNDVIATFQFGTTLPSFSSIFPIIKLIEDSYLTGKVTNVKVLYANFESFFSQKPDVLQILPISMEASPEVEVKNTLDDIIIEPSLEAIIPSLLKHYLEMTLYQCLLESYLSEQAARMLAMQNATTNAKDIIQAFKLEYNKTRQAKITSELLDITGGRSVQTA